MKLALFADIHANLQALHACIEHAHTQGATQLAFVGDMVGYGANPGAVLDTIMDAVEHGAWIVRGNHEDLALHPPSAIQHAGQEGAQWTHAQLSPAHQDFLAQLPLLSQHGKVLLVHASAHQPERWPYIENSVMAERSMTAASDIDPQIRYVFSGHVHQQSLYYLTPTAKLMRFIPQPGVPIPVPAHRQWLAIVGACGQPRDGDVRAMYALYDSDSAAMTFHRVPYDHAAAVAAILQSDMPDAFGLRLEQGR